MINVLEMSYWNMSTEKWESGFNLKDRNYVRTK